MAPNGEARRFTKDSKTLMHIIEGKAAMNITNDKVRNTLQTTSALLASVLATVLTTVLFLS
jgi:thiamine biosynthesis lipoprotein ApbE